MDITYRKTTFIDSNNQKNIQGGRNRHHSEGVSYFSHSCHHHPSLIYQLNQLMDLIGQAVLRITSLWAAGAASATHYVCPLYCTCLTPASSSLCRAEASQHSFIFKRETRSKGASQVEVKLHNYRLGCCRLAERRIPLRSTDACDGNSVWAGSTSHQVLDPRLYSLLPFPLSSPVSECSVMLRAKRASFLSVCIRVESYMGTNGWTCSMSWSWEP